MTDLLADLPLPSGKSLQWLLGQGVPFDALHGVKSAWVKFNGDTFDFDAECAGEPVLIFACEDQGEVVDLVAWSARENILATWRSTAFALGDLDQCFNPATWFADGMLQIHRTPLDWLKAGGDGIVILNPKLCWAYLRNVPRLAFADISLARQIKAWLLPPEPQTEFLIEQSIKEIAA